MGKLTKRLLAAILALVLAAGCLCFALASTEDDDWREALRKAFGLSDDASDPQQPQATQQPKATQQPQATQQPKATKQPQATQQPKATQKAAPQFKLPVTDAQQIVNYLAIYGELPENFITKEEARWLGWDSRYNYVGEVAPGMSIGGDWFGNYDRLLPTKKGRRWYECDVNYRGKGRGSERLIYSSDGLYYYTRDHYQTFTQMFPEG